MKIVDKRLDEIRPYEKNPRRNDAAVEYVAESIKAFGWKQPIVIDKDGVIIVGHTRYKAAQSLGIEKVPCLIADDLTPEQVKAYRLADNKTGELAEWDFGTLEEELAELVDSLTDIDMADFGFADEIDEYPNEDELDADTQTDDKTVERLVFQTYKDYAKHEDEIKDFAESIGAAVTVGK